MNAMIDAIPAEALDFESEMKFYVTRSMARNYLAELKTTSNSDSAYRTTLEGKRVLTYEGHDIVVRPDYDNNIRLYHNDVYRHRAILTIPKNFIFATDGASDDKAIQSWYNIDEEMHRYRVKYRAQTAYKHADLLILAY